ncbi:MAG: permease [Alphaproteobacteria bacterium]|nr:permease [Alphaproteobacteria bacterium]
MELGLILTSVWLGILTSISPCTLTTNIAAVSYIGQKVGRPHYVMWSGLFYMLGRTTLYTLLGLLLSFGFSSIPIVSQFLQVNMPYIVAPSLIIIGLMILDILKIPGFGFNIKKSSENEKRGLLKSFGLGMLFAMALCPVSAALFLGNLIQTHGNVLAMILYGIGTGLPVLLFAFILAFSVKNIARIHSKIIVFEKWARKITGIVFVLGGIYYSVTTFGISLNILSWFTYLADYITYGLLSLNPTTYLSRAVHFFIEDVTKILFLLFFVTYLVSFFRSYLNPEKVRDYLKNKPKWLAYLFAVILGSVTPFCSCSSIPLFIGFVEAGIPFGVTMSFLITSPLINEVAIVILGTSLGWHVTVIYLITGMIIGLMGGLIMERMHLEKYVEDYVYKIKVNKNNVTQIKETLREKSKYAIQYSWNIINKVWPYIIIGVGIGAFMHGFVPQSFMERYLSSNNLLAVPMAVLLGIPLYSNAIGIIPIAEVLLTKGVPIGTVFAMMMSIVAISLPELIILRKVMKPKLLIYFALMLFVMIVFIGYFYNIVL